jgi:hypothetical protein
MGWVTGESGVGSRQVKDILLFLQCPDQFYALKLTSYSVDPEKSFL